MGFISHIVYRVYICLAYFIPATFFHSIAKIIGLLIYLSNFGGASTGSWGYGAEGVVGQGGCGVYGVWGSRVFRTTYINVEM